MDDPRPPSREPLDRDPLDSRTITAAGVAACGLLLVFETANVYLFQRLQGAPQSLASVLAGQVPWWTLWMLFMPPTLWLARAYRFEGPRWRRSALVHTLGALAISLAHVVAFALVYHLLVMNGVIAPRSTSSLGEHVRGLTLRFWFQDVLTYGAAVGIYNAFEYFSRFRRLALAAAQTDARAARLQTSLAEARVHALRMELNPHFLFNALNAVAGLVRKREHAAAIDTLERLGDLLRTTLDREMPPEVALSEELELLRRFLDIEKVRFGDRLHVAWDVEPEAQAALVPPLILQPLVENALRHGIARRPGAALLRISARRVGSDLELSVRDTGDGLAPLNGRPPREGIGLSNTRARLEQLYGAAALLELTDVVGGGARARLAIPFHLTAAPLNADTVAIGA